MGLRVGCRVFVPYMVLLSLRSSSLCLYLIFLVQTTGVCHSLRKFFHISLISFVPPVDLHSLVKPTFMSVEVAVESLK